MVVLAAAAIAASGNAVRADFNFPDFSSTVGLTLMGSAGASGSVLRVSPSNPLSAAGVVWHATKQPIGPGFTTDFTFRFTNQGGAGGEGLAFVIQNAGPMIRGTDGIAMGYGSIVNSLAIEFDARLNPELLDPNGNHVSVQSRGTLANSASSLYSLGHNPSIPALAGGSTITARVIYAPGSLQVLLNGDSVLVVAVDLSTWLSLDNGGAWVGFTASGGTSAYENHDVLSWSFASACYPNCDASTTSPALNVLDFACFLNKFTAGESYANCDSSTTPPVLNVLDFACFLNKFAAGCP